MTENANLQPVSQLESEGLRQGGETGRRTGLKIRSPARGVWVRFPSLALTQKELLEGRTGQIAHFWCNERVCVRSSPSRGVHGRRPERDFELPFVGNHEKFEAA